MRDLTAPLTTEKDLRYGRALELAAKLDRPELWRRLFRAIDDRGFFGEQFDHFARRERERREHGAGKPPRRRQEGLDFGVFEKAAADLERYLLPVTIELEEWERFLHYLLVAANLRGLAEALVEPEILAALVRSGRLDFARQAVARVHAPEARARALCAVAAALPGGSRHPDAGAVTLELRAALDESGPPRTPSEAETWCAALEEAARTVPLDHRRRWPEWIGVLEPWPELADRVRIALAGGFVGQGEIGPDAELWDHLAAVREPAAGLAVLEVRLEREEIDDPWPLVAGLAVRFGAVASWRALLAAMRRLAGARSDPEPLQRLWRRGHAELGAPPWTADLVDAGGALWGVLPRAQVDEVLVAVADPAAAAALLVAAWKPAEEPGRAGEIRQAVARIPPSEECLRRHLDYLWALRQGPRPELRAELAGVSRYLGRERFAAAGAILVRWLDLVAELEPGDLGRELDGLLWSPAGTPGLLRTLVERSASLALQEALLARAESHAATVAVTEAEGFELRRELIFRLTCRRCREAGTLEPLAGAITRLLPEEEDELRAALAEELAGAGRPELAEAAALGIVDRRRRLLARLQAYRRRPVPDELTAPLALYEAVASVAPVEDELAALGALQEPAGDPAAVAAAHLTGLHRRGRQVEGLVDFAWHSLETQRRRLRPRDQDRTAAVLPLRQALGVVESQEWLLALAPELVELGSRLGRAECLAEVQEVVERVVQLDSAPWPARAGALEAVLAAVPRLIAADWPGVPGDHPVRARTAARLMRWLAELPGDLPAGPGREALRRDWHRILAWMTALLDRLPVQARLDLGRPLRAWLRGGGPGGLERWLPRTLASPRGGPDLEVLRAGRWEWLGESQEEAVRLCRMDRTERLGVAEELLIGPGTAGLAGAGSGEVVEVLAYLLATTDSSVGVELLERLPSGAARDDLCFRLVRHGWLERPAAGRAAALIGDGTVRLLAAVGLSEGAGTDPVERGGLPALAEAVAGGLLPPDDPSSTRLRHALWRIEPSRSMPVLARAAVRSLDAGGGKGAEAAARWWLGAALAPDLGGEASDGRRRLLDGLRAAAARALSLRGAESSREPRAPAGGLEPGTGGADAGGGGGQESGLPAPARLESIERGWRRISGRRPRALAWVESPREALGAASAMVAIAAALSFPALDRVLFAAEGPAGADTVNASGGTRWLLLAVLICGVQALLVDRFLDERFPDRGVLPAWWRRVRPGAAAVPLFGLYVLPAWQWLLAAGGGPGAAPPGWSPGPPPPGLPALRRSAGVAAVVARAARRLGSPAGMAAAFVTGFVVFFGFALAVPILGSGPADPGLLAAVVGVHLAAAGAAGIYLWLMARRLRLATLSRWGLAALATLWLVPSTGAFLGLLASALALSLVRDPGERSLGDPALSGAPAVAALPAWQHLVDGIESVRRRERGWRAVRRPVERAPRGEGEVGSRLHHLCLGKVVLLFLEVAAVGWALRSAVEAGLPGARVYAAALPVLGHLTLAGGTVALAATGVAFAAGRVRPEWRSDRAPLLAAMPYFAGVLLAASAGVSFGEALAAEDAVAAGGILALVGLAGALAGVAAMLRATSPGQERLGWLASIGSCSVGVLGMAIARDPTGLWSVRFLEQLLWLGPAMSVILGAAGLSALRLALGEGGGGTAVGHGVYPTSATLERPWLVAPAVLPLGALAVPSWILAWHRRQSRAGPGVVQAWEA